MRDMSSTAKAAFRGLNFPALVLVQLDFTDGIVRLCNAAYTFKWDKRGNLITDTDTLLLHNISTAGNTSVITDLGSGISAGVAHIAFNRTGTLGADRRVRTSAGTYSTTIDKSQDSTYTVEIKPVQGTAEIFAQGPALDNLSNSQLRFASITASGDVFVSGGCTLQKKELLGDGFYRLTIRIPKAFWTGSGNTLLFFAGGGWDTIDTREFYYRKPLLVQDGTEWLGIGNLGGIEAISEGSALQMYGCSLTLTGIPPEMISEAMSQNYQGRPAKIWLAPLTEDYAIIADPVVVFAGRMDTMDIELGSTATISLAVESRLVDWERPRIRRFNDQDQRSEYPDDRGFQYVDQMIQKDLKWARP